MRFFVPVRLRPILQRRYIIRRLPDDADDARLLMGVVGVALSHTRHIEHGGGMALDLKRVLAKLQKKQLDELLTINGIVLPNGATIQSATMETPEDEAMLNRIVDNIGRVAPDDVVERPQKAHRGVLLADAIGTYGKGGGEPSGYLGRRLRDDLDPKTYIEFEHTLRLFLGLTGNIPVNAISEKNLQFFIDEMQNYPKNASQRKAYKGLAPLEALALGKKNKEPKIAWNTLNKHYGGLNQFLDRQVLQGDLAINQLALVSMPPKPDGTSKRNFTDEELKAIFGKDFLPWACKYPHRFFAPMLGLYSGRRVNDIAQLYCTDIEQVEGMWGFHVRTDEADKKDKKVKNKATISFVPLAQEVLDAGFIEFVGEARKHDKRLFRELPNNGTGYGVQLSKQFSVYVKSVCKGIEDGVAFHAFRHTISTVLYRELAKTFSEDKEILALIAMITGHDDKKHVKTEEKDGESTLSKFYVHDKQVNVPALKISVKTLSLMKPPVTLPTYADYKNARKALSTTK